MQHNKIIHKQYSLYTRRGSPYYYVRFWDAVLANYGPGRSTEQKLKDDAERVAQSWLAQYKGFPPSNAKQPKYTKMQVNQVVNTYLKDLGSLAEGESVDIDELLARTDHLLPAQDLETKNPVFTDYLTQFWDWGKSSYIKDKLEAGQTIAKPYCDANKKYIQNHAVPYFSDMRILSIMSRGFWTGKARK